jgi:hypothetical protein
VSRASCHFGGDARVPADTRDAIGIAFAHRIPWFDVRDDFASKEERAADVEHIRELIARARKEQL